MVGGAPPPQGSELVGEVGDATPQGSVGGAAAAAPQGPEAAGTETVGGGEGPAEPTVAVGAAAAGAPQGSTALSSIRELCRGRHQGSTLALIQSGRQKRRSRRDE